MPFLASIVLVIVGLIIRAKVPESPVFDDVKAHGDIVKSPIVEVIKNGLAKHPARHRPSHRRDRRLRRVHHLHAVLPQGRRAGDQVRDHRRAVHRRGDRHLRHLRLGEAHRQDRPPPALPLGVRAGHPVRRADVRHGEHRGVHPDPRDVRHRLRRVPERARRLPRAAGSPNCSTRTPGPRAPRWPTRSRPSHRVSPPSSPRCCSRPTAGGARPCCSAATWRSAWSPRSSPARPGVRASASWPTRPPPRPPPHHGGVRLMRHRQDVPPRSRRRLPHAPPRPEHGRGAGPGIRRSGSGCRRHAGRRLRRPAALPGRRPALGRTGPVPAVDGPLRHRAVCRAGRSRHRRRRRTRQLRIRRITAADVRNGQLHTGNGDLRRIAGPRPDRCGRDGARTAPPGLGFADHQLPLRRRTRRGLDVGGGDGRLATTSWGT